ncbi:class I SAM-dependent methyltransferase [bacterium]|nr:class I SAM-dependent methyltransferase [bacterium]
MPVLETDECLICKSKNINKYAANFSQFIADRVFDGENKTFKLLHCKECGFAYFNYRMSDAENLKLYENYRDFNYQQQRQKSESWYTKEINALIGNNKTEIDSRNIHLSKLLQNNKICLNFDKNMTVLDFGGDSGQFIPETLNNCQRYVYDISGKTVLDGIKLLKTLEECKSQKYDLVICAHVLEHITNPDDTIKTIKSLLSQNGLLYIELPFDSPFYKKLGDNLQYLFNPHFRFKDIVKHFFSKLKSFRKKSFDMHEHINYFTLSSAEILLTNNDFKIISSEISNIKSEVGNSKIISVLAKI